MCRCSFEGTSLIPPLPLSAAGLRRSFRLSRKDRQGSSGEGSDLGDPDLLTYEEVTRYQQRPNERPRLVVLIGETPAAAATLTSSGRKHQLQCLSFVCVGIPEGSLGARINELKQRVIAENPHHFAVAVPRECH